MSIGEVWKPMKKKKIEITSPFYMKVVVNESPFLLFTS
jgi:hypothetical protein